jgi:hypothetical protein
VGSTVAIVNLNVALDFKELSPLRDFELKFVLICYQNWSFFVISLPRISNSILRIKKLILILCYEEAFSQLLTGILKRICVNVRFFDVFDNSINKVLLILDVLLLDACISSKSALVDIVSLFERGPLESG